MPNSFNCTNSTSYLLRDIFNMALPVNLCFCLQLEWTNNRIMHDLGNYEPIKLIEKLGRNTGNFAIK